MRALLVPHNGSPRIIELEQEKGGSTVRALQAEVKGNFEVVQLSDGLGDLWLNEDGMYVCFDTVVDEAGKEHRIPQTNELATYLARNAGALTYGVLGDAVITGPVGRRGETTEVLGTTVRYINRLVGVKHDGILLPNDWNGWGDPPFEEGS